MFGKKKVSIVSPAWNEARNLPNLIDRLVATLKKTEMDYEILIVENGSTDDSIEVLEKLRDENKRIRYLKLSRNFGHQGALVAGLDHCIGDCAITIDADLQQPPELISEMIALWQQGYDVIYTSKAQPPGMRSIKEMGMMVFYRLMSAVSGMKLKFGQSDFRLMDRKLIDVLKKIPEREKFLRGLIYWMGFKQKGLTYEVGSRTEGRSKFSFTGLIKFAVNGILAFSMLPLRLYLYLGLAVSALCLFYAFLILVIKIVSFYEPSLANLILLPPGWATVVYLITVLGGIQLIGIGLLGEYLAKTLKQVKGRPVYIVEEKSGGIK